MQLLNLTLPTPAENLAFDEALIEQAELSAKQEAASDGLSSSHPEVLRLWEPAETFVVIGRSSSYSKEVNTDYCQRNGIPIFRRVTGGAAIVTGRGCLMYAVLLDYRRRPELRMLDQAHKFVMDNMAAAVGGAVNQNAPNAEVNIEVEGICDLTIDNRKVSGNSLRCKRNWMVYHGTMICDFDRSLIQSCLDWPKRTPDYRQQRSHEDFVGSIPVSTDELAKAIQQQWQTDGEFTELPLDETQRLATEKYQSADWNRRVP